MQGLGLRLLGQPHPLLPFNGLCILTLEFPSMDTGQPGLISGITLLEQQGTSMVFQVFLEGMDERLEILLETVHDGLLTETTGGFLLQGDYLLNQTALELWLQVKCFPANGDLFRFSCTFNSILVTSDYFTVFSKIDVTGIQEKKIVQKRRTTTILEQPYGSRITIVPDRRFEEGCQYIAGNYLLPVLSEDKNTSTVVVAAPPCCSALAYMDEKWMGGQCNIGIVSKDGTITYGREPDFKFQITPKSIFDFLGLLVPENFQEEVIQKMIDADEEELFHYRPAQNFHELVNQIRLDPDGDPALIFVGLLNASLETFEIDLNFVEPTTKLTLFLIACALGWELVVSHLAQLNVFINDFTAKGFNAFDLAILSNSQPITDFVLSQKLEPAQTRINNQSLLNIQKRKPQNFILWEPEMVTDWALNTLSLTPQYAQLFSEQWINGEILAGLDHQALLQIGFPLGIAYTVQDAIIELKNKEALRQNGWKRQSSTLDLTNMKDYTGRRPSFLHSNSSAREIVVPASLASSGLTPILEDKPQKPRKPKSTKRRSGATDGPVVAGAERAKRPSFSSSGENKPERIKKRSNSHRESFPPVSTDDKPKPASQRNSQSLMVGSSSADDISTVKKKRHSQSLPAPASVPDENHRSGSDKATRANSQPETPKSEKSAKRLSQKSQKKLGKPDGESPSASPAPSPDKPRSAKRSGSRSGLKDNKIDSNERIIQLPAALAPAGELTKEEQAARAELKGSGDERKKKRASLQILQLPLTKKPDSVETKAPAEDPGTKGVLSSFSPRKSGDHKKKSKINSNPTPAAPVPTGKTVAFDFDDTLNGRSASHPDRITTPEDRALSKAGSNPIPKNGAPITKPEPEAAPEPTPEPAAPAPDIYEMAEKLAAQLVKERQEAFERAIQQREAGTRRIKTTRGIKKTEKGIKSPNSPTKKRSCFKTKT